MLTYATITTTQELLHASRIRRRSGLRRRIIRWQAQRRRAQHQQRQPDVTFSLR